MSENDGRKKKADSGPGWFATLGGAAVLIVLGFGVGLVAGAAWEEPELVMDHFAGRTTEVPLLEGDGFDSDVSVDTSPPEEASRPLGSPAESSPAERKPQTRPARSSTGGHAIQVGAFGDRNSAQELVETLRKASFSAYIVEDTGGSARFKVRVGPFVEREAAEASADRLKKEHRLPTWILSRDGR